MRPSKETGSRQVPVRLPWRSAGLAALAFVVLLALVVRPAHADPPPVAGVPAAFASSLPALLLHLLSHLW